MDSEHLLHTFDNIVHQLLPLAGVIVGWGLNMVSAHLQRKRERKQRLHDLRLATYAEWIAGVERTFNAYATQSASAPTTDVTLCEKRLLLLEADVTLRQ